MKKLIFGTILTILLSVSLILAVGQVDITNIAVPSSADPGTTITGTVTVNNALISTTIAQVNLVSTNLVGTSTITAPSISSIFNLAYNTPQTTSFSITIPSTALPGSYTSAITATENGNTINNDTFNYAITVNSKKVMTLPSSTVVVIGHRDESTSNSFTITNNGNVPLNNVLITPNIMLIDSSNNTIALTLSPNLISSILVGSSASVTLTATVPSTQVYGRYKGILNVVESDPLFNGTIPLEIDSFPKICSNGQRGNFFNVKITDPSSNSEFLPNDNIDVTVNVENKDSNDREVIVEVKLYDIKDGKIIKSAKSSGINIDANSNEDIELTLTVPYKFNEDHSFILFAKAYEDGNEDDQCKEANLDLDLDRRDNDVIINDLTFFPSSVKCGDSVDVTVNVWNIGRSDEDSVKVNLRNTELGINQLSNTFSLGDYGSSDDDEVVRFSLLIPTTATTKSYSIETITTFNDGSDTTSKTFSLDVACQTPIGSVTLNLLQYTTDANTGTSLSIPLSLTNNLNSAQSYTLEFIAAGGWANSVSQTVTLNPLDTETLYLYPIIGLSTPSGVHSGTINVKSGSDIVASRIFTVNVLGTTTPTGAVTFYPTSYFDKLFTGDRLPTSFWIIGDIALLIIAIYFIRLLLKRQ